MIDKWLSKTKFNEYLKKLAKRFNKISANQVTIIALIFGLLSALMIFLSEILTWRLELIIIAVVLMVISFFLDALDGVLARVREPTVFGGILVLIFTAMALIPTPMAWISDLVGHEDLAKAMSLRQALIGMGTVLGALIGGYVIGIFGVSGLFLVILFFLIIS